MEEIIEGNKPERQITILSNPAKNYLLETAKWGKFLSILGFIFSGLIVLLSLVSFFLADAVGSDPKGFGPYSDLANSMEAMQSMFVFMYFLMALLYFFPSYYLYNFSIKTKLGILNEEHFNLDEGLKNLKSTFKFWGVFTAIILGLYAIMIIGVLLTAVL